MSADRFCLGLAAGCITGGLATWFTDNTLICVIAGVLVALFIWTGLFLVVWDD